MSDKPARRIIVHAGFHKTGTTTLQSTLALNAALLLPHVETYLQEGIVLTPLRRAVLEFSANRCKATKQVVFDQATAFFQSLDLTDPRPVFVSSESLSGHFPGSGGVGKYGSAPIAIELIREAWIALTGKTEGFATYYSTRREGWLASCHWQRLKVNRTKMNLEAYCEKYAQAADHDAILDDIRARLGEDAVFTAALEDMTHPVDPVLALLGLTGLRPHLILPPNANVFPGEDARDQLLALNRSKIWGDAFERAKLAILEGRTSQRP